MPRSLFLLTSPATIPSPPPALHPANNRFFTPLFSASSESLFSQILCFQIYLRCPLVFQITNVLTLKGERRQRSPRPRHTVPLGPISLFRMNTCKSVSKQRTLSTFRMNTYAKTGGGGLPRQTQSRFAPARLAPILQGQRPAVSLRDLPAQ